MAKLNEPMRPIILASASAARARLLQAAGVVFDVRAANIDEAAVKAGHSGTPQALALALAEAKACHICADSDTIALESVVIGADQLLVCEDKIYDKPQDMAAARAHLQFLRGKAHILVSGVVLVGQGALMWQHVSMAQLTMRDFSDDFLDAYLEAAGEAVLQSVGAYQLEGLGAQLFHTIEGEHSTILGLPLMPLLRALRSYGGLLV